MLMVAQCMPYNDVNKGLDVVREFPWLLWVLESKSRKEWPSSLTVDASQRQDCAGEVMKTLTERFPFLALNRRRSSPYLHRSQSSRIPDSLLPWNTIMMLLSLISP